MGSNKPAPEPREFLEEVSMIRTRHVLALGLALAPAVSALAQAQGQGQGQGQGQQQVDLTKAAGTEASNISTVGDWFRFNTRVTGFTESGKKDANPLTAARDSCFRVSGEF